MPEFVWSWFHGVRMVVGVVLLLASIGSMVLVSQDRRLLKKHPSKSRYVVVHVRSLMAELRLAAGGLMLLSASTDTATTYAQSKIFADAAFLLLVLGAVLEFRSRKRLREAATEDVKAERRHADVHRFDPPSDRERFEEIVRREWGDPSETLDR